MIKGQTFIKLQGRIQTIYRQDMKTVIRIYVDTYQNNYPEIVLVGDLRKKANSFTRGEFIYIEGEFSLTSEIDVTGKKHYYQIIKAKKVEKAKTILAGFFNLPCGTYYKYINEIYIAGIIDGKLEKNGVTSLFIKTNVNSKHLIRVSAFRQLKQEEGQFAVISGNIQTKAKTMPDGSKYTFQNIILGDIDAIEDNDKEVEIPLDVDHELTEGILPEEYNQPLKNTEDNENDIFSALE